MARRFLFEKNRPHTIVRMNGKKVGTKADLRDFLLSEETKTGL